MRTGLPKEPASLARKGDFKGWALSASPFRSANKKAATRLVAADRLICGTPIPRRPLQPTQEAYPNLPALSKGLFLHVKLQVPPNNSNKGTAMFELIPDLSWSEWISVVSLPCSILSGVASSVITVKLSMKPHIVAKLVPDPHSRVRIDPPGIRKNDYLPGNLNPRMLNRSAEEAPLHRSNVRRGRRIGG